ncbi:MAG TPA: lipopolysaccharide biosynthesis protein RfbH [Thermoleophilaceae bacterium]
MTSPARSATGHEGRLRELRAEALAATRAYAEEALAPPDFVRGETWVPVAGRVIGAQELEALVDASLDGWLTEGRFAARFVAEFAHAVGRGHALLVGSGSQANLLAAAAMCSHLLERPLRPGDEVITPAVGFSTTVTPIYQVGLVPVYVDVEPDTLGPTLDAFADAISDRTRVVLAAHCLGNPFDGAGLARLCAEHDLVLIEDCCDALGSTLGGRRVGTFGTAATYSFYAAHHMTTGEGGAIAADDPDWVRALGSLREWGRDCWCPPGVNDACGRRFDGRFGDMPAGYDHKYVFSQLGFNFKVTDMQAALGLAQLDRLEDFGARRRANFARLDAALADLDDRILRPRALPDADPSWFGYPFALRDGGAARRRELQRFLQERRIDSRLVLGGNLTRQPGYRGLRHRIAGPLDGADAVTESSLWVGCYPGLTDEMVDWIAESVREFLGA